MKQIIYKNKWFKVIKKNKKWFYIEENFNKGAVILIKIKESFIFVKVFRIPINKFSIELPRGFNQSNESSIEAAIREAYEETGIKINKNKIIKLGSIYPNNGILNSEIDIFFTELSTNIITELRDKQEISKILKIKISKINFLISKGIIKDAFTLSALTLYNAKFK